MSGTDIAISIAANLLTTGLVAFLVSRHKKFKAHVEEDTRQGEIEMKVLAKYPGLIVMEYLLACGGVIAAVGKCVLGLMTGLGIFVWVGSAWFSHSKWYWT